MNRALWVDASQGIAGDMLLGALVEAGAPRSALAAAIQALSGHCGDSIRLEVDEVRRHGLRATQVKFLCAPSSVRRRLADVLEIVKGIQLEPPATEFACRVFTVLADAEAWVHGVPVGQVHFHEVGALDSLADVVGSAVALDALGLLEPGTIRVVSEVALGGGTARTEHGVVPVPVPAALRLLSQVGAPVTSGPADRELCTPTGAALIAALATGWGPLPAMTLRASGSGAGSWDPPDHANLSRVVLGESRNQPQPWLQESLQVVETTVDDLDPRLWPEVLDKVHGAGALDVWLTAVLMRHGRPGHVLTALTRAGTVDAVLRVLVQQTTTLGVRVSPVDRRSLPRDSVSVSVSGQAMSVKRGLLDGVAITSQPEYADAVNVADTTGLPLRQVIQRAAELGRDAP